MAKIKAETKDDSCSVLQLLALSQTAVGLYNVAENTLFSLNVPMQKLLGTKNNHFVLSWADSNSKEKFEQLLAGNSENSSNTLSIINEAGNIIEVKCIIVRNNSAVCVLFETEFNTNASYFANSIIHLDLDNKITQIINQVNQSDNNRYIGMPVFNFIDKQFHDLAIKTHQQVKNEQVVASYNIYGSGSNGNDSWFKIQVKPVINNEVVTGIILISQIITEQYKNDEANAHFLSQLEATIESTADGILLVDKLGRVSLYNKKFLELWRIPPEILELRDDNSTLQYVVNQLKYPDDFLAKVQWLYDKPDEICFDVIEFIDGRVFERYSQAQLINGSYAGRVWSFRDITSRLQAEEAIKQSLQEKEVLLKEVHHRVKNNLQIISSIINLQAANINDPQTLEAMRDSQSRIRCMGYIHELLYQNKDFSSINFKEYISSIANSLLFTYSIGRQIQLKLSVQEIHLNIDVAIACGLIVNELLTNSLKYAFTIEHRNKYIEVTAAELDGKVVLTVADNGKGLEAGFDINNYETLGMQLVSGLVEQIDGALRVINKNGVLFEIEFFMTSKLQH